MSSQETTAFDRYRKQILFEEIGTAGQQKLRQARVAIVGCGALGSMIAETLARSGIGHLTIIDRDFVDLSNLQRQHLFDELDVAAHLPKAIAARDQLQKINSQVSVTAVVDDLQAENAESVLKDHSLIMDGTDNFETRFLVNDVSLETGIPWISGGVLAAQGQVFMIVPERTACLRCLMPEQPPQVETCDTAGVLGPAVNLIATFQVLRAMRWLVSDGAWVDQKLTVIDAWQGEIQQIDLSPLIDYRDCAACQQGERLWLHGKRGSESTILCGRNAVQISPANSRELDLNAFNERWQPLGSTTLNPFLLWFRPEEQQEFEIHLFPDGRAIIKGTEELAIARTIYNRYAGN